jgi:alkanesulfonate monooxygenase SsuD/methylene tetrahydromethanopterin reductase-like flavin-dependent oxidoreductase (luciferase family)
VPVGEKKAMWREATEQVCNMLAMDPYPGYQGKYFSMPARNVVPKTLQRPHPPLWVACSNRGTILEAARLGIGALTFAFIDEDEARQWVKDYYDVFKRECVPIGHTVNPNVAMVSGFSVHPDRAEAERRGLEGFKFFGFALGHHYAFGEQRVGRTDVWRNFQSFRDQFPGPEGRSIGTPDEVRARLRKMEDAGVDQVVFIQQAGRNQHEHICESLELFAREILPEFQDRHEKRESEKLRRLAPALEAAMRRRERDVPAPAHEIGPTRGTAPALNIEKPAV